MKKLYIVLLWSLLVNIPLFAQKVGGVDIQEKIRLLDTNLTLNGAGVRSMFIFDIYVGALYLQDSISNPQKIIDADSPMDIRMIIISSLVSGSKIKEGFSSDFKVMKSIGYKVNKQALQRFFTAFSSTVHKNDIYDFLYIPKKALMVYKNKKMVTTIKDFEFKKALYAIWLGEKPAQESLKNKMLGM